MDRDIFESDSESESFDSADEFSDSSPLNDVPTQPMASTEKWDVFQVTIGDTKKFSQSFEAYIA